MTKKIETTPPAFIHGIAERRSRNVDWAEKAVREERLHHRYRALREKVIDLSPRTSPASAEDRRPPGAPRR